MKELIYKDFKLLRFKKVDLLIISFPLWIYYILNPLSIDVKVLQYIFDDYLCYSAFGVIFYLYFTFIYELVGKEVIQGTLEPLLASPVSPRELWLSKVITVESLSLSFIFLLDSVCIAVYTLFFKIRLNNWLRVAVFLLLYFPFVTFSLLCLLMMIILTMPYSSIVNFLLLPISILLISYWHYLSSRFLAYILVSCFLLLFLSWVIMGRVSRNRLFFLWK